MGKSHFLHRTFSHFGLILKRILKQLRVIGQRHVCGFVLLCFFFCFYCTCWYPLLCFITQIILMLSSIILFLLLIWWMSGCFCFSLGNKPCLYSFSSCTACVVVLKREIPTTEIIALTSSRQKKNLPLDSFETSVLHFTSSDEVSQQPFGNRRKLDTILLMMNLLHKPLPSSLCFS